MLKEWVEQYKNDEKNLNDFIELYKSIPIKDCEKTLSSIDKLEVLKLISIDLGRDENVTCSRLSGLDKEHRISLLEHCFSINDNKEDAHKKAILISNLLDIEVLFKNKDQTSQSIKKHIYWAITPESYYGKGGNRPYYNLKDTRSNLQGILTKTEKATGQPLSEIKEKLTKALQTLNISEPKPELKEKAPAPSNKSDDNVSEKSPAQQKKNGGD